MTSIKVDRINNFTSSVTINNKKMTLVDKKIERAELKRKQRKLGNILHHSAIIIGILAFLYILGIAGHSDYCTEAHIADEWSFMDYIVRLSGGVLTMCICMKVSDYGIRLRGYYRDWKEED